MLELYNEEINKYLNKDTNLNIYLEFNEDEEETIIIDNIKFPKLQSYKDSGIYENIIEYISDNYYNSIIKNGNITHFIPYDEPKYLFDIEENIIEITFIHDNNKYRILKDMNLNVVEYSLYDNYYIWNVLLIN